MVERRDGDGSVSTRRAGARAAGIANGIVAEMLALEQQAATRTSDPARLFPDYVAAVEQLARAVDAWRV